MKRSFLARGIGLLVVLMVTVAGLAFAAPQFPALGGRVVDQANILSPGTEARLAQQLEQLEMTTGRQLVVVTLQSLQGYEIEDFGYQLGRAWKIGRASEDDGTLFIVAPHERSVRIEVGYGLEAVLTDALASVLLNERVLPHFRAGDMETGVIDGTEALAVQLALPPDEARERVNRAREETAESDGGIPSFIMLLLVFWILMLVMRGFGSRGRRRSGWMLPPVIVSGGGWGGRGGSRGGGFSRGGFSGGGGSFGGGGASGRW
jgi:uncharacterized protein